MQTQATRISDQAVQTTLSVLKDLLGQDLLRQDLPGSSQQRNFAVRLWDGTTWQPELESAEPKRFTLALRHPRALRKMLLPPSELSLGEAYIYNDFDIEGDITAVFPLADQFINRQWGKVEQVRYGKRLLSLPKTSQARSGDAAAK